MKVVPIKVFCALVTATLVISNSAYAQQTGIHHTDLQRHDLSIPGWETIQTKATIDPGIVAPRHRHPGDEIVYVLQGTLEFQLDGNLPLTLKPGDVLFIPAGVAHSAKNVGTDEAAELSTYVVEKGKPLVEWIK
jgi:quercetin dioxygenase-like cupin family protein